MTQPLLATSATLLLALVAAQAQPQTRKPSTPEDRAKAVEIARALESDPLSKQSKELRERIIYWLIDIPDITVKACDTLLGPLAHSKKNYATEIFIQMLPSSAAFIIEHPEESKDDIAVYTAAVEGALRTYQSILKMKPKARWPFLDDLVEKRDKGELAAHVRQAAVNCK